jgi:hypothetical protein
MEREKPSPYRVQVLDRGPSVLGTLAQHSGECSLAEVSSRVALHKSTVHRILMVLERHRLVLKNSATGRYRLGLKPFELGSRAVAGTDLRENARPILSRVMFETDTTVHLCLFEHSPIHSPVASPPYSNSLQWAPPAPIKLLIRRGLNGFESLYLRQYS